MSLAPPSPRVEPTTVRTPSALGEFCRNAGGYLAAAVLAAGLMAAGLRLWRADLTVPLVYAGDNLLNQLFVQAVIENGWYLENTRLGAPGGQSLHDFPLAETLHFGVIKLLGALFGNPAVVLNLFSLLPFPLIALSSYFVLRRFKLSRLTALVPSVLYACLPYHFSRCTAHVFLSAYFLLPLMTLVLLRIYLGRLPAAKVEGAGSAKRSFTPELAGAVLVCALAGVAGVYYAFFSCYLLLAVGVKVAFRERKWAPVMTSLLLIAVISLAVGAALAPSFLYMREHGTNPAAARRHPVEADVYGLNVTEMLLPVMDHRLGYLKRLHQSYMAPPRHPTGESFSAPLGLLGALGFVWLIGLFLWRRRHKVERADDGLAYLALIAVMLGTIGGLGAMFNFHVTPMIRCYNRISVYIAFFSLFGLFMTLERLVRRVQGRAAFGVQAAGAGVLLLFGAWDQTAAWFVPPHAGTKQNYEQDADFGRRMEEALPAGAMVYQMPCFPFPEHPRIALLADYELLRPYFHTKTLRWSYGAMKGREAGRWQETLAQRPLPEVVRSLAFAGFGGIYLDRAGFSDFGASVEKDLARLLKVEPLLSGSGRQSFFVLTGYANALRKRFSASEWRTRRESALHPVTLEWVNFADPEPAHGVGSERRCGPAGELRLYNPLDRVREGVLKVECRGWQKVPARLLIDGGLVRREVSLTAAGRPLELKLLIPPGEHVVRFSCDGPFVPPAVDPRGFVFRLRNIEWRVEE
jgi:phosphoglycerol transferase